MQILEARGVSAEGIGGSRPSIRGNRGAGVMVLG
jgi:hypothetical protein